MDIKGKKASHIDIDEVAIIGMSCRFPGANDYNQFWQNLEQGINSVIEIPTERWSLNNFYSSKPQEPNKSISKWGGFIPSIDQFDAKFFRISPREAVRMDPQQRLMLELSWACLEDAGYSAFELSGRPVGVFIGACNYDYDQLQRKHEDRVEGHTATGSYTCIIPNRISYLFNFSGPSVPVDTACSSSLVAIHQAINAIKEKECELALVGGISVLCAPESYISFSQMGMLSPNGQCKAFDSKADGYVRGEGAGIVLLKSLEKAIEDKDNIYGVIKGSAINHGGKAQTLTSPNAYAQAKVIRAAFKKANIAPNTVSYIETHGTGTPKGDPIEINGLKRAFRQLYKDYNKPQYEQPYCGLGAVKTNIGHLESAAGIAGLIKVILAMKYRKLPKITNFQQLNPRINLDKTPFYVVRETQEWNPLTTEDGKTIPLRAGVSSFGFGGVNAHVIVEEAPSQLRTQNSLERPLHLLTISAKTEKALEDLVDRYHHTLELDSESELADICYTANTGRVHFERRLAILSYNKKELIEKLLHKKAKKEVSGIFSGQFSSSSNSSKIAFLFTGQGSQYVNMGRELYQTQPSFRLAIDRCHEILSHQLEHSLLEILYPQTENESSSSLIDRTAYTQPALFAVEYALYKLWQSWGIKPDVVMGHSVGEYVAATVAGVFSLEDALKLISARGRLMQQLPSGGEMIAVNTSETKISSLIIPYKEEVAVASVNGPNSVVISGASEAIRNICSSLQSEGINCKKLLVSHAFHSPLMEPLLLEFAKVASQVSYSRPSLKLISNVTGQLVADEVTTPKYWCSHLRQPVRFASGIATLHQLDCDIFLECGPKNILVSMGKQCLPEGTELWLSSLDPRQGSNWQSLIQSLAKLYLRGVSVDWNGFDRDYSRLKVRLPTYPWQGKRYWVETSSNARFLQSSLQNDHPLLGYRLPVVETQKIRFLSTISLDSITYLKDSSIFHKIFLPSAAFLESILAATTDLQIQHSKLKSVFIHEVLVLAEATTKTIQLVLTPENETEYFFKIYSLKEDRLGDSSWTLYIEGLLLIEDIPFEIPKIDLPVLQTKFEQQVSSSELYGNFQTRSLHYGLSFQGIKQLWHNDTEVLSQVILPEALFHEIENYTFHPVLLDACIQTVASATFKYSKQDPFIPVSIESLQIYHSPSTTLWCHVRFRSAIAAQNNLNHVTADLTLIDETGTTIGYLQGLVLRSTSRWSVLSEELESELYQVQWQPKSLPQQTSISTLPQHWLIFANRGELGTTIIQQLQQQGHTCSLIVLFNETSVTENEDVYHLQPNNPVEFKRLWSQIEQSTSVPLGGVVYLWSLDTPQTENLSTSSLEAAVNFSCENLLYLMQTLVKQSFSRSAKLWVITEHAVVIDEELPAVAQAPVWGIGKVFSLESPGQWGGLIDLDAKDSIEQKAQAITAELFETKGEEYLAYRKGTRYVARLAKNKLKTFTQLSIRNDGSYLITGGLGGLGLAVAQWLVEKGARHLILLSRSGANTPRKKEAIKHLEQAGVQVVTLMVDVSNHEAMTITFHRLRELALPIRGVLHIAGIEGASKPIVDLEVSELLQPLQPKVLGTWNLHELTANYELNFFVNFSSIAAVWGSARLGGYAAANQFLDIFTSYRRLQGFPALGINWTGISGTGLLQEDRDMAQTLEKIGVGTLNVSDMIKALDLLLGSDALQTVVAPVDWERFGSFYQATRQRRLLEFFVSQSLPEAELVLANKAQLRQQLESVPKTERLEFLRRTLKKELGQVLRMLPSDLPDSDIGFFELGMDSLMSVEFRNRLAKLLEANLPTTLIFDYPNIESLLHYLSTKVLSPTLEQTVASASPVSSAIMTNAVNEPIAIVGMNCYFPGGATSIDRFWHLLNSGTETRSEIPNNRWDIDAYYDPNPEAPDKIYTRFGHFVSDVELFDADFFGISPREAKFMDPQQRLLLQVSWEALENAAHVIDRIAQQQIGVFIGNDGCDYQHLVARSLKDNENSLDCIKGFTGNALSALAGRISYTLGFTGPCMTIDTGCSSSLVAVHQACNSLRQRECSVALAGGVKLHLSPIPFINTSKARMLSADGRCKTFDRSANGYARGEGCGVVVLKKISDAVAQGDNILAVIRGSAVNQDGPSGGFTVPNGQAQQQLIRQALAKAQVEPAEVGYLEAHGTGTSLGDPIEVNSAATVLSQNRSSSASLLIGSVKANIGHLEAAAGISGLIKVVLALQHRQIPRQLHVQEPNQQIDWEKPIQVPTKTTPWIQRRIAGVSSFGFTGVNAHLIVEEAPLLQEAPKKELERPLHILTLSARNKEALKQLTLKYTQYLPKNLSQRLSDICFTANIGRLSFKHRISIVGATTQEINSKLIAFSKGKYTAGLLNGEIKVAEPSKVAFLFTGQGSQYVEMGRQLYESQPTFRKALQECDRFLRPHLNIPLLEVIYPPVGKKSPLNETAYTQPALFAIEYSLYQLWRSWGIIPSFVMGHSVGEYVAAHVAGIFSLEDGLKLMAARGRLMQQLPVKGVMVSLTSSVEQVRAALSDYADEVAIAAINGPKSTVISGEERAVQAVVEQLNSKGVKSKQLEVSHAFHSPLMQPMLAEFEQIARQINYFEPQLKILSSLSGTEDTTQMTTPDYWCQQVLSPVNFAKGMQSLHNLGCEVFIEIGPKPILLTMCRQGMPENAGLWLPSLRPSQDDWSQMLQSLGELYIRGVKVDWAGFERDYSRRKVMLPTYPFQKKPYWVDTDPKNERKSIKPEQSSSIMSLLHKGETQQLARLLEQSQEFSRESTEKIIKALVKEHQEQLAKAYVQELLFKIKWQPQTQQKTITAARKPGQWILIADQKGVGLALAQLLREQEHQCFFIPSSLLTDSTDNSRGYSTTQISGAFEMLLHQMQQASSLPLHGVIHLSSLDTIANEQIQEHTWKSVLHGSTGSLFYLVQVLTKLLKIPSKLWIVTRQAQVVENNVPELAQTPQWGLGRVIAIEHPDLWGGLIDLDTETSLQKQADHLLNEILQADGENQIAYRRGQRYVARLVPSKAAKTTQSDLCADGSYLIAGGLGALGLKVAQWLVTRGASYLVLMNRHGVTNQVQQEVIRQLESSGVQVKVMATDITDLPNLQKSFKELKSSIPAIKGIIHSAGVLDDGLIVNQSWERFDKVMAPKVQGAWNLHILSQELKLNFFLCFSSAASLLGNASQSNYAAANAFLDGLCYYRNANNLPSLSLNWGPWAKVGMAAELSPVLRERLARSGMKPIELEHGLQVLEQQLGEKGQIGVLSFDWEKLSQQLDICNQPFFISVLSEKKIVVQKKSSSHPSKWWQSLKSVAKSERLNRLKHLIQQEVSKILALPASELPPLETGFFELGMDSLMTLELLKQLNKILKINLPANISFDFPNIERLAHHILTEVFELNIADSTPGRQTSGISPTYEPIAIIGMSCRFPEATNLEGFWQLLYSGSNTRSEIPKERWNIDDCYSSDPEEPGKMYTRFGNFLKNIDRFDPAFFGISPREAVAIDPQHRLLLEVSWEALEHAGWVPQRLAEQSVGVFIGNDGRDYEKLVGNHLEEEPDSPIATYAGTGTAMSSAAGRLSYTFGFTGPSITIDTACSSSLVAIHQACTSLRQGECHAALAGGVKLHLTPDSYIATSKARMLSADGLCKTFDASADGYARGEGCGLIVLKSLSNAMADGDNILAVIRGSAVNQDGLSSGLTAPNGQAQQKLIRQALTRAKIQPAQISYLEAHGTGTSLGDPIELSAALAVLGQARSRESPLLVGSVKTNIGHLESAAGISGVIKVVLAMQHKTIPPHLNLNQPNPQIGWEQLPFKVPKESTSWESLDRCRAGVSSFGFTGTNSHIVLEEAPPQAKAHRTEWEKPFYLLTLSAKSKEALQELALRYSQHLPKNPEQQLSDICFSANTGRFHFDYRLSVVTNQRDQLAGKLLAFSQEKDPEGVLNGQLETKESKGVAFLFTGQGSQYIDMGRQLYQTQPCFRQTLEDCDQILRPYLEKSLLEVIYPSAAKESPLNEARYTQPALFAIEYALYQLWKSWGITPTVVMGHSVGEYVAACAAGIFSVEDGLRLIAARSRLMQQLPVGGTMVSLRATLEQVRTALAAHGNQVAIAAINGPQSTVISGKEEAVKAVVAQLESEGIKSKQLEVSHAFHSPLMQPMLEEFEQIARQIDYFEPQINIVSNVTGRLATTEIGTPQYWCQHVLSPVNFAKGMQSLQSLGYKIFLEIGSKPILLGMGCHCLSEDVESLWLPSLRPSQDDWSQMLQSLGELYVRGHEVDWTSFERDYPHRRVVLPTYPFQRQSYWIKNRKSPLVNSKIKAKSQLHPLIERQFQSPLSKETFFESLVSIDAFPFLADHQIYERVVIPGAFHISFLLAAASLSFASQGCRLEDIFFPQALAISQQAERKVQAVLSPQENSLAFQLISLENSSPNSGSFNGREQEHIYLVHATGNIAPESETPIPTVILEEIQNRCRQSVGGTDIFTFLQKQQIQLGKSFRWIDRVWVGEGEILGCLQQPATVKDAVNYQLYPSLVDSCFQLLAAHGIINCSSEGETWIPFHIERFKFFGNYDGDELWCYCRRRQEKLSATSKQVWDIQLFEASGQIVALIEGFESRKANRESVLRSLQKDYRDWLYEIQWQSKPSRVTNLSKASGHWLVLAPFSELGELLKKTLEAREEKCILVYPGNNYRKLSQEHYELPPLARQGFEQLIKDTLVTPNLSIKGIVHLWSLQEERENSLLTPEKLQTLQELGCGSTMNLLQALASSREAKPPLWLVTLGAQAVEKEQSLVHVEQTPLWGLGATLVSEHPELQCRCLDLDPTSTKEDLVEVLVQELLFADEEDRIAYRQGARQVARLERYRANSGAKKLPILTGKPFQLKLLEYGSIDNLILQPLQRRQPQAGEVEIKVKAAGLNFRDVLNVLGMLKEHYAQNLGITSAEQLTLGMEAVGVIVAVGEEIGEWRVGDEVMTLLHDGFSSYVTVGIDRIFAKPKHLSFSEAATLPLAFSTAYYGLHQLGKIRSGERVLIHAGAGGVGQAAIQLALQAKAEIFATASPPKWKFLQSCGIENIFNSRTLEFGEELKRLTKNTGIDIVLNSLNGEFIDKSLENLVVGGRFIELGKIGILSSEQMHQRRPDIQYFPFDLLNEFSRKPELIAQIWKQLATEFNQGNLQPLPHRVFPIEQIEEAFRFMQKAKHIGKVVITLPDPIERETPVEVFVKFRGSYLITGGMGSLGLQAAQWLVKQGVRELVLVGRREPSELAQNVIGQIEATGTKVTVLLGNIAREEDVARILDRVKTTLPPLKGIIHAAGVLDDGVLQQQSWERFVKVMNPKVLGAWHLHCLTQSIPLDFFLCFSSTAALFGSSGQGNYAAANAFMDGLAYYRRSQGLPGLSINWGPWSQGGMAAQLQAQHQTRMLNQGIEVIPPEIGMQVMGELLKLDATQVGVIPVNWTQFLAWMPVGTKVQMLEAFTPYQNNQTQKANFLEQLQAAPIEEQYQLIVVHLQKQIARVLGIANSQQIQLQQRLFDLGLDSLMAVELRNILQESLNCSLSSTLLFDYPTLVALADYLAREVLQLKVFSSNETAIAVADKGQTQNYTDWSSEIKEISEQQLEQLINQKWDLMS